jgi:hypothetical protein
MRFLTAIFSAPGRGLQNGCMGKRLYQESIKYGQESPFLAMLEVGEMSVEDHDALGESPPKPCHDA